MNLNHELFDAASALIPGGVNSPVRAFKQVGGTPIFIERGEGAHLISCEQKSYIDYVGSWGCLILGHAHPEVISAVIKQAHKGLGYGAPTRLELEMAETLNHLWPTLEKVRLVNSGTEATMSALRLARGATKRDKIIKFAGNYHGHTDALLAKAGSGVLGLGLPDSCGIPKSITEHTLIALYNDLDSVTNYFEQYPDEIAAIIVEPVAGNMNCVPARYDFLHGLRALCSKYQSVLIFDEVMSGFRVSPTGGEGLYQIKPDLICLGKIIGGGLPVGAFGGRAELMDHLAPLGTVYQAGTLSGNPVTVAAGLAQLQILQKPGTYERLEQSTHALMTGMRERAEHYQIALQTVHRGSMFGLYFTEQAVIENFAAVQAANAEHYRYFFHAALEKGLYFAPSAYEAGFVSLAHDLDIINQTLEKVAEIFAEWPH